MITRINNEMGNTYSVKIEYSLQPDPGVRIVFHYDPQSCALQYEHIDTSTVEAGCIFRIYNREFLQQLQENSNPPLLRTLLHTERPTVIIDPGHGGIDTGTIGVNGTIEKNICLSISQYLADILGEKGCTVFLTRNRDVTLPLDERTSYTNSCYADCFISIHANAALNRNAQGIETFCLPNNKFKECFSTLSFPEKAVAIQKTSLRSQYSHALAQSIQHSLCATIAQAYNPPVDRKVKNELFQVLLGSQIPAILVEVGFLSHNIEADMLNSEQYQKTIAHGIATGIMSVFSSLVI
jgi:N-acetylmuramoyl-L-alanine amidase